ncbi:MAG: DUF4384 domain-containing protein [Alphaproteobacteria bacterium]|nr:DUF4384 domain-containing protein [Alphaproteobacteria bacterium]
MRTAIRNTALAAGLAAFAVSPAGAADPYKDLSIEQREMVVALPPPPVPAATAGSGGALALTTTLDRADGRYRPGESVALTLETNEDAYVWVFDTGTSGRVHQIFPNEHATDNFMRAGHAMTLPGEGAQYQFVAAEPTGVELLTVIASRDNTPIADHLVDRNTGAGPFLALQGTAASVSKDLQITIPQKHPKSVVSHQVFRIVQ